MGLSRAPQSDQITVSSERLRLKNLALVDGKPLISYALEAAVQSGVFDRVVLNADHEVFAKIAIRHGVEFYHREQSLGSSDTLSDHVVADFMEHFGEAEVVAWINPIAPLQSAEEISNVVKFFVESELDSLVTVETKQVHSLFDGEPVNYNPRELFRKTQDLVPVNTFAYSVMMWRSATFLASFRNLGHGFFSGSFGVFPVSKASSVIVKGSEDLSLVDAVIRSRKGQAKKLEYDSLASDYIVDS